MASSSPAVLVAGRLGRRPSRSRAVSVAGRLGRVVSRPRVVSGIRWGSDRPQDAPTAMGGQRAWTLEAVDRATARRRGQAAAVLRVQIACPGVGRAVAPLAPARPHCGVEVCRRAGVGAPLRSQGRWRVRRQPRSGRRWSNGPRWRDVSRETRAKVTGSRTPNETGEPRADSGETRTSAGETHPPSVEGCRHASARCGRRSATVTVCPRSYRGPAPGADVPSARRPWRTYQAPGARAGRIEATRPDLHLRATFGRVCFT